MTTVLAFCTGCRRPLRREPTWDEGKPYGPDCAKSRGLRRPERVRARKPKAGAGEQPTLFDPPDETEINEEEAMPIYRKRPIEVQAIQFTGDNVTEIWDAFGTDGIYGPTETNPDHLILTTTHGDPAPARSGDWVVPDSKPGTFYPIKPDVFEATYEPAVDESSPPPDDICGAALRGGDRVWCCDLPVGHGSTTLHQSGSGTYWGDSGPEAVDRG